MPGGKLSINGSWWVPSRGADSIVALVRFGGGLGRLDLTEDAVALDVNGRWNLWKSQDGPRGTVRVPVVMPLAEIRRVETKGRWLTRLRFRVADQAIDGAMFSARRSKVAPALAWLRSHGVEVVE